MPAPIDDEARSAIAFYAALGYSQREIADTIGLSRNTVRKYLRLTREVVDAADDPRETLAAIVRDEYEWEDPAATAGFGDLPM